MTFFRNIVLSSTSRFKENEKNLFRYCFFLNLYLFNKIRKSTFTKIHLEQRQNKNDYIQSKIIANLKLPRFFPHRIGGGKARQFHSWNFF